jgi:phage gp46-like protein
MDITHVWHADPLTLYGDWVIDPPDLESDADLRTSVIISLFTDGLAAPDDQLPDPSDPDRRGWWGDTGTDPPQNIGSKLWIYTRAKWTDEVRLGIEETARASLQWMLDDGAADQVIVTATRDEIGRINLSIVIERDGNRVFSGTYGWAWAQEFLALGGPS